MSHLRYLLFAALIGPLAGVSLASPTSSKASSMALYDAVRSRRIPIEIYYPHVGVDCKAAQPCPVAILSAGYGVRHTSYSFIALALNNLGYLVVAVQHELASDPPLATAGDLFALRTPAWKQGADNIRFVRDRLSAIHTHYDWQRLALVGHSHGGDISAWLVRESPSDVVALVTLDHRRVPLPTGPSPRTLSFRASEVEADLGVLTRTACITKLADTKHNDMSDVGSSQFKQTVIEVLSSFLSEGQCPASASEPGG